MNIKVKKLTEEAIIPAYAHEGDAGMDVYSVIDESIEPGGIKLIPTGLSFELPRGIEMQVRPKSGLAIKHGITVTNSPGTLDSGYRGELKVVMQNEGKKTYDVKTGEKIAQIVLARYEEVKFEESEELTETTRGAGGFGSTGQ